MRGNHQILVLKILGLRVLSIFALAIQVNGEILLRPIGEQRYGGPHFIGAGSIDACSDDLLVATTQDSVIYQIDMRNSPPKYTQVAGDTTSLLKKGLYGSTVKCFDSNTIYRRDTWCIYRIRLDQRAVDTLIPSNRSIVYNLVYDTLENLYAVAGQSVYKIENSFQELAKSRDGLWNMAICDSNHFMGVGAKFLHHYRNGKWDSIPNPRGYQWFSCLWIRDRFMVRDQGMIAQAYTYHPDTKTLKKMVTDPDFDQTAWGMNELSYTRFENKDLIISGQNVFILNDSAIFKIEVLMEGVADPVQDGTSCATFLKSKDIYMLSGGRVAQVISAKATPVGLMPMHRFRPARKWERQKLPNLSGYRPDGIPIPIQK